MSRIIIFILIIGSMIMTGCSNSNEASNYGTIQEKLVNMKGYKSKAEITYISNKGEKTYTAEQGANNNGQYKIITTKPEEVKDCMIVYDGKMVWQYNPRVESKFSVSGSDKASRSEIILFSFIKNYVKSENVSLESGKTDESLCTVLEAIIGGENEFLYSEKLWIDNDTFTPAKLIIYDKEGEERIIVEFDEFEYNPEFEEGYFSVDNGEKKE